MKNLLLSISSLVFLYGCGGGSDTSETQFYKTQKTTPQTLDVSIEASGAIEAISSVEIKSKASGEVLFLGAEVGDSVNKGSTLAQIDQRTANNIVDQTLSDLEAAKVRLVNAESQYKRGKELHKNSSISDKDFEDIKENYAQAKSTVVRTEVSLEKEKISLDDTLVKSPISGTIISRPVEVGQVISSPTSAFGEGSILMTMADLSKVRVRALVDEIDVGKVRLGQSVSIKVAAYRDKEFIGTVTKIEPKAYIQQNVTTFPVLIDIDNKENLLLIGMNTDVVIQILNKDVSLSVPTMSLRTRKDIYTAAAVLDIKTESIDEFLKNNVDGENFNRFIIIKDSKKGPNLQWVKVGVSDLYNVEIIDGLEIGDVVYILPSKSLFDYQERFKKRVEGSFSFG